MVHNLIENPLDLPVEKGIYLCKLDISHNPVRLMEYRPKGYSPDNRDKWLSINGAVANNYVFNEHVIAWKEVNLSFG